ncbi:RNA polymerase sigma factor region1.1 domain-containing protein [Bradyrhizobium sp. USDA 4353]
MQDPTETTALQRLLALGRERGVLTADDLKSRLPIAEMTERDLAGVISVLEDAGVPVEIDAPTLPASGWRGQPIQDSTSAISGQAARSSSPDRLRGPSGNNDLQVVVPDDQPRGRTGLIVLLAGAMSCGVLLLAGWHWHW